MKQIEPLMQREKPTWRQFTDLEGETFGRLKVESYAGVRKIPCGVIHHYWNCVCECATHCVVSHNSIIHGKTTSCGCFRREKSRETKFKHGLLKSKEYTSWIAMRNRCFDPGNDRYQSYGGRGITVCDRWFYSFEDFLADMGPRPLGKALGRIDKNGNYEVSNCSWMTPLEIAEQLSDEQKNLRGRQLRAASAKRWADHRASNPQKPKGPKRNLSPEQRDACRERLKRNRANVGRKMPAREEAA
ncbi:MAG TPA: hypothetical protein VK652_13505 [Steroidobacteraceae bacterium]|nr:hypothetical protein [Steroidobacteraceae bacterium]